MLIDEQTEMMRLCEVTIRIYMKSVGVANVCWLQFVKWYALRQRQADRQTDRQMDRQTDRQIDRQTDRFIYYHQNSTYVQETFKYLPVLHN